MFLSPRHTLAVLMLFVASGLMALASWSKHSIVVPDPLQTKLINQSIDRSIRLKADKEIVHIARTDFYRFAVFAIYFPAIGVGKFLEATARCSPPRDIFGEGCTDVRLDYVSGTRALEEAQLVALQSKLEKSLCENATGSLVSLFNEKGRGPLICDNDSGISFLLCDSGAKRCSKSKKNFLNNCMRPLSRLLSQRDVWGFVDASLANPQKSAVVVPYQISRNLLPMEF